MEYLVLEIPEYMVPGLLMAYLVLGPLMECLVLEILEYMVVDQIMEYKERVVVPVVLAEYSFLIIIMVYMPEQEADLLLQLYSREALLHMAPTRQVISS